MFEKKYPYLSQWILVEGRIEFGSDYMFSSLLRLLNEGGMVWEDKESKEITEALEKAESYLKNDFSAEFGYEIEV